MRAFFAFPTILGVLVQLAPAPSIAQDTDRLEVGETVRVNGSFVGRVVAVDGTDVTVFGQGPPNCTAGVYHGDGAICTPAPTERQTVDIRVARVERPATKAGRTKRILVGAVLGGAAGAAGGYALGPVLGMGGLSTCVGSGRFRKCGHEYTPADVQHASDQRRGALFLGVVGATVGGLIANELIADWARVEPLVSPAPAAGVGLEVHVLLGGR